MSTTKRIQIRIKPNGEYILETLEGFSGASCVEQTANLEQTIGGGVASSGVKPEFYNSDDDAKAYVNF